MSDKTTSAASARRPRRSRAMQTEPPADSVPDAALADAPAPAETTAPTGAASGYFVQSGGGTCAWAGRGTAPRFQGCRFVGGLSASASLGVMEIPLTDGEETHVERLDAVLPQVVARELQISSGGLSAVAWKQLARLTKEAIDHRIALARLRKLTGGRPRNTLLAIRRMTAREIAERVREVLIGPPIPDIDPVPAPNQPAVSSGQPT